MRPPLPFPRLAATRSHNKLVCTPHSIEWSVWTDPVQGTEEVQEEVVARREQLSA